MAWSASYASAKTLEREESILSSSFCWQMADYYSHFFSLINQLDEFSFKEIRTWGQSKISSFCLCVWCKSREWRGSGNPRFKTPMVEVFSADLLPAIKSHWAELDLELFVLLQLNLDSCLTITIVDKIFEKKTHFQTPSPPPNSTLPQGKKICRAN